VRHVLAAVCLFWGLAVAAAEPQFPALNGRVVDAAGLLDEALTGALTQRLADHEKATTEQVVVATVTSLDGLSIEEYATALFRHWRLGQRDVDNGVLLLVAPEERKVRIEVGYGLEGRLTDLLAGHIIRERILPRFKADDYPGGIQSGVAGILEVLTGVAEFDETAPVASRPTLDTDAITPAMLVLMIASMVSNAIFKRRYQVARAAVFGVAGGIFGWWLTHFLPVAGFFALFAALFSLGGGGGSRSGGSGGWSSGGGGFSGGGGSSGGGGASGSW